MKKASLTIVFLLVGLYAIQAQSLYVSSMKGNVNVRTAPSTAAAKIGTLAATVLVPCIEELDGWYKIEFNGKEGYVAQAVATTCEANIPLEMFGKYFTSSKPLDKIRHQGTISIDKIDNTHVMIHTDWMRVNLPAESQSYVAELKDGKITAKYSCAKYVDEGKPLKEILNEMEKLEKPIPMGFDEFNNTLYFNGGEFSEFE
ncbi:SH3 domain-containing protein [Prevotella sp. PINT]|jgi:Uncharacterized protein with a bacterial SH3 domain homologue|uniref:SH3 domain-containing protein n=1 Tax=Palleniella intestinalis TaxID=2736291 RepID=UPI001553E4CD|nr:SH3 domain-containing protein [Palleniella intestinalis]NPD82621.1 SH3 domain-containing protein [Palleniella intestinalis]